MRALALILVLFAPDVLANPRKTKAKPVFAWSAVTQGLGGGFQLDADRRWEQSGHAGDDFKGRLTKKQMRTFRALLAAAKFEVEPPDPAKCPADPDTQAILVDFERDRVVKFHPPCTAPDDATGRLSLCIAAMIGNSDATDECRIP